MNNQITIVFDKMTYKENEEHYKKYCNAKYDAAEFVYTEYENQLIRIVRKMPIIGKALQHILYWIKSYNYARSISKCKSSTILCINPIVGIFLGLMNKQRKNIILTGFLFEPKNNKFYYNIRKKFTLECIKGISKLIVYSNQEVEYYEKIFGTKKFCFIPYGIDYCVEDSYERELPDEYIFSGGGSNRDYETLFKALNGISSSVPKLVVATLPNCVRGIDTGNAIILNDVVLETFGDVERKSKLMVLSLKDSDISAGHQVLLEALKNNVLIVVNRISAVEDYVSEEDVVFYKTKDSEQLRTLLIEICENYNSYKTKYTHGSDLYFSKYTFDKFIQRLLEVC